MCVYSYLCIQKKKITRDVNQCETGFNIWFQKQVLCTRYDMVNAKEDVQFDLKVTIRISVDSLRIGPIHFLTSGFGNYCAQNQFQFRFEFMF